MPFLTPYFPTAEHLPRAERLERLISNPQFGLWTPHLRPTPDEPEQLTSDMVPRKRPILVRPSTEGPTVSLPTEDRGPRTAHRRPGNAEPEHLTSDRESRSRTNHLPPRNKGPEQVISNQVKGSERLTSDQEPRGPNDPSSLWVHETCEGCAEMGVGNACGRQHYGLRTSPYGATKRVRGVPNWVPGTHTGVRKFCRLMWL